MLSETVADEFCFLNSGDFEVSLLVRSSLYSGYDQLLVIQIFFHSCENADTLKLIDLVRLSQSSLLLFTLARLVGGQRARVL